MKEPNMRKFNRTNRNILTKKENNGIIFIPIICKCKKCINVPINPNERKEEPKRTMCKKLKELSGMSASKILELYAHDSNYYAVDMQTIMNNIGVPVLLFDFSDLNQKLSHNIYGAIVLLKDNLAVLVSNKCTKEEQRFILAHELAHCCLHGATLKKTKIEFASDFDSSDLHEEEAHSFADQLLLPEKDFIDVCKQFDSKNIDVETVADIFCVPRSSVIRRIKALGLQ